MPLTPRQKASARAAIDVEFERLSKAADVPLTLPPGNPEHGPVGHLLDRVARVPYELIERLPAFRGTWLDRLRDDRLHNTPSPPKRDQLAKRKWKGITGDEQEILREGSAFHAGEDGTWLIMSPAEPGSPLYVVTKKSLECVGQPLELVRREVDAILAAPRPAAPKSKKGKAKKNPLGPVRESQTPADQIRASLIHGVLVENIGSAENLAALHSAAEQADLKLVYGFGDAENSDDDTLCSMPWVLGVELSATTGGADQKESFLFSPRGLATLSDRLGSALKEIRPLADGLGLQMHEPATYLVASGGLCYAMLVRGEWTDPPDGAERDRAVLDRWLEGLTRASDDTVGHLWGTRGATQDAYPGAVRGLFVAGTRDQLTVDVGAKAMAVVDKKLVASGIKDPQFFLVARFD